MVSEIFYSLWSIFYRYVAFASSIFIGIREIGKGSLNEREVGKSQMKLESLKLENSGRSWKVRTEVEKFGPKLDSLRRSWIFRAEVGKFELKLESSG